jgi:hypothetical protein
MTPTWKNESKALFSGIRVLFIGVVSFSQKETRSDSQGMPPPSRRVGIQYDTFVTHAQAFFTPQSE